MKNILIDLEVDEASLQRVEAMPGVGSVEVINTDDESPALPVDLIGDKHILLCGAPPSNLDDMKSLEFIQLHSAGYSQLYGLGLPEKGIIACNARGVQDIPIAEWSVAMMINLARDLRSMIRNQDAGVWDRDRRFQREIMGSVVGIWGYGGLGRQTARLAKALGMAVHALDVQPIVPQNSYYVVPGTGDPEGVLPDRKFTAGQEEEFLSRLDFLVLTMPLTKSTEGIVGERELRMLPRSAYLLNPARGPLVQEKALIDALRERWIAGAALDTHYYYPMPPDHPLWYFPNVLMTPHISGSMGSTQFMQRIMDIFSCNVDRFIAVKPLLNQLTDIQLKGC